MQLEHSIAEGIGSNPWRLSSSSRLLKNSIAGLTLYGESDSRAEG
jgi:hypothetical protein